MKFGKLLGLIVLLLGLYLLWRVRLIVLLAFSAVTLATVLNRIVRRLVRWGVKRGLAIAITLTSLFLLISMVLTIAIPPLVD